MLDPNAKALAQAIRRAETGGSSDPYNARGASGEFGAYQFMPDTYRAYAQKYLGNANADPTVENQNKIAYSFVKEKKDAGYNPAQIASMWNAGEKRPDAYKQNFRGTNSLGVQYDVPAYAQKVSQYYRELAPKTQTPQKPKDESKTYFGPVGVGQAIAAGFSAGGRTAKLNEQLEKLMAGQRELLSRRNKAANEGKDTSRYDIALEQTNKTLQELGATAVETTTGGVSPREATGAVLETAAFAPFTGGVGATGGLARQLLVGGAKLAAEGAASGVIGGAGTALRRGEDVGKGALTGGALGLVTGGVLGAASPFIGRGASVLGRAAKNSPESIMQRVARISKTKQIKFESTAGESVGKYLVNRGIYGDTDQIVDQLAKRFVASKSQADAGLATIQGFYKPRAVKSMLDELVQREIRVSAPGALSPNLKRATALKTKYNTTGLTMSDINEVKRLYEKNVKLEFIKAQVPEKVARANNIDNAVREWQFEEAAKQGFTNLAEINRETRLARQLMDALGAENAGLKGNNAISLTDWIILADGDPTAAAAFIAKKTFSNKKLQSWIAKTLAGEPTIGMPQVNIGPGRPDLTDFLKREP